MLPGDVIEIRYTLREKLGQGGNGTVWRAYDDLKQREVAVKLIEMRTTGGLRRGDLRHLVLREGRAAYAVRHPGVVEVHDISTCELRGQDYCLLVMDFVDGPDLRHYLAGRTYAPAASVDLALQLVDAVAAVHAAGVVHRDIKPGNILVDPQGRIRLTDFGIARLLAEVSPITVRGHGTKGYASPQQVAGLEADPADDVYSLGRTFETLLRPVPSAAGLIAAMTAADRADRPGLEQVRGALLALQCVDQETTVSRSEAPEGRAGRAAGGGAAAGGPAAGGAAPRGYGVPVSPRAVPAPAPLGSMRPSSAIDGDRLDLDTRLATRRRPGIKADAVLGGDWAVVHPDHPAVADPKETASSGPAAAGAGFVILCLLGLVAYGISTSGAGPGLAGDYTALPAATSSATSAPATAQGAWTPDGPFAIRIDGITCAAVPGPAAAKPKTALSAAAGSTAAAGNTATTGSTATGTAAPSPTPVQPVDCTVRAEVRDGGTRPLRYLPFELRTDAGTWTANGGKLVLQAVTLAGKPAPVDGVLLAGGRTGELVYRFRAEPELAGNPLVSLEPANGAPADALTVARVG